MWQLFSDAGNVPATGGVASNSTRGDRSPNLPALSGLTMSQLSVVCLPLLIPPWKIRPWASRALTLRSNPFQWSIWLLPGKNVALRPMKLLEPAAAVGFWLKKSVV